MSDFKKENNLMGGKGEDDIDWITVKGNHIPIKDGENPQEAIKNHFANKNKVNLIGHNQPIKDLISVLNKIKHIKIKDLKEYIKNLSPIKLTINDNEIVAEFDEYTAKKNIFAQGKSDKIGFQYKLNHIENLPSFIQDAQYSHSTAESGKKSRWHKGVKEWHYFTKELDTDEGKFNVVVNIRDKGLNKFIYEVVLKKKKV